MQAQVYLAKCAFSQHLANFVQFELGLGRLAILFEAINYQLLDKIDLLRPRRQLGDLLGFDLPNYGLLIGVVHRKRSLAWTVARSLTRSLIW